MIQFMILLKLTGDGNDFIKFSQLFTRIHLKRILIHSEQKRF